MEGDDVVLIERPNDDDEVLLHPASLTACSSVSNDTITKFKELENDKSSWTCISTDNDVLLKQYKETTIYRLQGHCDVSKERILRMNADFNPDTRRWDPLIKHETCQIIEQWEKTPNMIVVEFAWNVSSSLFLPTPTYYCIAVVHTGPNWITFTIINNHRHAKSPPETRLHKGWMTLYIHENTLVIMGTLESRYLNLFSKRIELIESVNKKWNYYYI